METMGFKDKKEFLKTMNILKVTTVVLLMITLANCTTKVEKQMSRTNVLSVSRQNCVRVLINDNPAGSGFFIDETHVATCCHVITEEASLDSKQKKFEWKAHAKISILCENGEKIQATCVSEPTEKDIAPFLYDFAVLELKKKPKDKHIILPFYDWKQTPSVGSEIFFSGFPLGAPAMLTHKGMVSGQAANNSIVCIQAPINKGNSGSALLNKNCEILGIISMREGGISKELKQLRDHINKMEMENKGSVKMFGVDPLQSTKEIVNVLDLYISTGIGYAININHLSDYLQRHKTLIN